MAFARSRTVRQAQAFAMLVAWLAASQAGRADQVAGPGSSAPARRGTSVVIGQVTEAGTTRPVSGATVAITSAPAGLANIGLGDAIPVDRLMSLDMTAMLSGIRQVLTDEQGRFAFTSLPAGTYSLQATKPGWTSAGFGQMRPDSQPMPLALSDGDALENVSLQLWKYSALSGTVVDEAGDAIVGLNVRALRRTWLGGKSRLVTAGSARTDDRGGYRLFSLVPGDYIVTIPQTITTSPAGGAAPAMDMAALQALVANRAAPTDPSSLIAMIGSMTPGASGGGIRVGDWVIQTSAMGTRLIPPVTGSGGRMFAYQTTYFPASTSFSEATIVTVGSGDDRGGLDFQMKPVAVMNVSGTVTGPEGAIPNVGVRLLPNGADEMAIDAGFETGMTTTSATGAFMFAAVPPGQYTLRVLRVPAPAAASAPPRPDVSVIQNSSGGVATSMGSMTMDMIMPAPPAMPSGPTLWADLPVSVGDAELTALGVPLRSGFRVSGRLAFDGTGSPPPISQFRRIPVMLDRAGAGSLGQAAAAALTGARGDGGQFDDSGQFSTYGVVPGKYFVRVPFSVGGWTLKSATLGGANLADVPLTIEDADVGGVVLTFTDRVSDLSGVVRSEQGNAEAQASVIVFPTDASAWIDFGSSPRRLRTSRTSTDGSYRFSALPPGDYLVAAVRGDIGGDWQNPSFLETVSRTAVRMSIGEGEKKTQDLRTSR